MRLTTSGIRLADEKTPSPLARLDPGPVRCIPIRGRNPAFEKAAFSMPARHAFSRSVIIRPSPFPPRYPVAAAALDHHARFEKSAARYFSAEGAPAVCGRRHTASPRGRAFPPACAKRPLTTCLPRGSRVVTRLKGAGKRQKSSPRSARRFLPGFARCISAPGHGASIDVRLKEFRARVFQRSGTPMAPAAAQVRHAAGQRRQRFDQKAAAGVQPVRGEYARVGVHGKGEPQRRHRDLAGPVGRGRVRGKVMLAHGFISVSA